MRRFAMALVAVMAVGASAQAQVARKPIACGFDPPPCPNGVRGGTAINPDEDTRKLGFNGTNVDGCIERPVVELIPIRHKVTFNTLIKVRANFTPEMQKSATQL